jgi:competence protein ComEA
MWKQLISGYFTYTKKERTGILALLSLIAIISLLPLLYPYLITQKTYDHSELERAVASLRLLQPDSAADFAAAGFKSRYPRESKWRADDASTGSKFTGTLFYFDPNTATPGEWKQLGIRDKTVATIQNYLSKGGRFYKKEDIGKVWGLHPNEVARLLPFVDIKAVKNERQSAELKYERKEYTKTEHRVTMVDVNAADTAAFIALPGIGSKLALRIINFREKLGGFYQVEQVAETFGLPDSTFQKIKGYLSAGSTSVNRININSATIEVMKSHPYIRYALGNAIIQYRSQHGNYKSVDDIRNLMSVTPEIFAKVAPYFTIE